MSKTMNIQALLTDADAVKAACDRLGYLYLGEGTFNLYDSVQQGIGFRMPGMKENYACVVRPDGTIAMDDYDWTGQLTGTAGKRMDESVMFPVIDAYGVEWAKTEARRQGYEAIESYNEETREIELRITV